MLRCSLSSFDELNELEEQERREAEKASTPPIVGDAANPGEDSLALFDFAAFSPSY